MSEHKIIDLLKSRLGCQKIHPSGQFYHTDRGDFFVKAGKGSDYKRLQGEAGCLELIEKTSDLRVPHPFLSGKEGDFSFLIVEAFDLRPHTRKSHKMLGRQLAEMHLKQGREKFGLGFDNTIGATYQINTWSESWCRFFSKYRLEFQLKMIDEKYRDAELAQAGKKLLLRLPEYFKGLEIKPSLLHGDLWSGNTACLPDGTPVVYDPASYWGHHEADLSMMGMFGGFSQDFFDAYHEILPKEAGFSERIQLYRLYHYLNHYLIFGLSYRRACLDLLNIL